MWVKGKPRTHDTEHIWVTDADWACMGTGMRRNRSKGMNMSVR